MAMRARLVVVATLLTLICLAGAPSACAAGKHALLVGIDAYPFVRELELQLHGAKIDVEQMGLVLKGCGFELTALENGKATRAAIRQELRALADHAGQGDAIVFYFSGRGSVAYDPKRPEVQVDLEPTLVPYDGQAQSAAADIPMGELETWAQELTDRGADVTIFLDACYAAPVARDLEFRFYKDVPRCVRRPGTPRAALYNGPGVLLAASDARGLAYEWRVDFSTDTWVGTFTDLWTNAAMQRLRAGQPSTYAEVMGEVHRFFAARPGYMPETRTYPSAERLGAADAAALYKRPIFAAAAAPPPAPIKEKIEEIVEKREQQEKTLRVGLEVSPPPDGETAKSDPAASLKPWGDYLQKRLQMAALVPQYGDRPDRILVMKQTEAGWEVRVRGDEVDESRRLKYQGKDVAAVMGAGLLDYLQRQAYVLHLFRLTEAEGSRPLRTIGMNWSVRSDKPRYRRGEPFGYLVSVPKEGLLYLLDQDQSDSIVQMIWPLRQDWDNRVKPGSLRLPRTSIRFKIPKEQSVGLTRTRAILIVPSPALTLPSLQPPEGTAWKDDTTYGKVELAHLRALLEALERKQAQWDAVTFEYEVTE